MSYDGYDDEYEYEDDAEYYYEDDEEYIDYTEDESVSDSSSSGSRFGGGGLPGSSSSGSRFGGGSGSSSSRFGGGSSSSGASSRFGGGSSSSSSGSSRFGGGGSSSGSSSRFGGGSSSSSSKDDDSKSSSSSSRFGGGSSSSGGSSRFGGGSSASSGSSSSRFGGGSSSSSSRDDDSKSSSSSSRSSSSRFGGGSSSGSSRFGGGGSSSGSSSRFGGGSSSSSSKDSANKSSSSSSRFGGGSSSSGSSSKDDKSSRGSSLFGGGSKQSDDKKDAKSDDSSSGGLLGGVLGRFGGGSSSDDKKDNKKDAKSDDSSSGGLLGGVMGRFGGGSSSDDKKDNKKDAKSDDSSSGGLLGGVLGRFGGGSSSDDKKDNKKDSKSSGSSGRFGRGSSQSSSSSKSASSKSGSSGRFGGGSKSSDSKKDDKKSGSRRSPFGSKKDKADKSGKGSKAAAEDSSGGVFGRLRSAFSFGSSSEDNDKSSKSSAKSRTRKVPKTSSNDGLTLDNWLDIIGVGLVVSSFVLFFTGISAEQAAIAGVHEFFGELLGWGALAVPIIMFVIGVWLIVRHFGDEAPTVDPIRMVGVAIVFVSTLVLFQYVDTFSYQLPNNIDNPELLRQFLRARLNVAWDEYNAGGGIIGAEIYFFLYTSVTEIGGFLLLLFTYLIGGMFLFRMSAAEIVQAGAGLVLSLREGMKQRAVRRRAERQLATLQAAEQLQGQGAPQLVTATESAGAGTPPVDPNSASGREIRMTVGGYAETVSMSGQQNGQPQPQPQVAYGTPAQPVPMQYQQQQNNNGGFLSRFRGGNSNDSSSGGFSLFGGGSSSSPTSTPAPPANLPVTPLPMDDGFSHFDNVPFRQAQTPAASASSGSSPSTPKPTSQTAQTTQPQAQQPAASAPAQPQATPANTQPAQPSDVQVDKATDEVNDFLKQRQERLNKLRKGEIGPISKSSMARAKQEDVAAAYVPSNEGQREEDFTSQHGESPVQAEASAQQAGDGSSSDFTPPSKLPSVQADGDVSPKQQRLSVPVDQPHSSEVKSSVVKPDWRLPDYRTLLSSGSDQEFDKEYLLKQASTIEDTLEAFGAPGRVVEINTGPVITQFGVEPDYVSGRSGRKQRVKVSAIAGLDKDLQLALGARSIRVEAPVPGKGYVGVEVPNAESTLVSLRDVMDSPGFAKHKTPLAIALGQSVSGAPISADLSTMPHVLIAGTTGSGKSVCVNSIIASIISRNTPDEVKFIMVDPKRVELTGYNGIPHLVAPVVVELERIVGVLKWVTREMDARYKQFSEAGSRNIEDFNKNRDPKTTEAMPYLVVIIDELADLMMLAPEETERTIARIAALARATGIHLVIATQRPSVDVVTGLIKANFPVRIAFAVAGSVDSRVILDQPGAERLLGKGDMLYLSGDSPAPLRLQGVFVSDMEINNIVRYWKMQGLKHPQSAANTTTLTPKIVPEPKAVQTSASRSSSSGAFWDAGKDGADDLPLFSSGSSDSDEDVELSRRELTGDVKEGNEDELYDKAVELVRRLDKASISLLQRRLRIGYTRAARLIDVMEARGVVGPSKDGSSKPRDVLPE